MKLGTFIKLGAVGVAAATTAVGSLFVTAKAVKKLSEESFPEDPSKKGLDLSHVPAIDKLISGGLKVSDKVKEALPNDDEKIFKTDFKYQPKPEEASAAPEAPVPEVMPVVEQSETQSTIPAPEVSFIEPEASVIAPVVVPEVEETTFAAPFAAAPAEIPIEVPVTEPEPITIATEAAELGAAAAAGAAAGLGAAVAAEAVAAEAEVPETDDKYTDLPMDLPYIAGKLDEDDKEYAEVVITPKQQKEDQDAEDAANEALEDAANEEAKEQAPEAATPEIETPVIEAPEAESATEEEISAELPSFGTMEDEPEFVLPTAEPIDEHPTSEPIMSAPVEDVPETFADINPLAQGFSVAMSDSVEDVLPEAHDAVASFADLTALPTDPSPVTFGDLSSEYVEEIAPVVEVTNEKAPIENVPTEDKPIEAEIASEPTLSEEQPIIEPVVSEPESESVSAATEPIAEPDTAMGKTVTIGNAVVSDKSDNTAIQAVVAGFGVKADNLVSISAEGNAPMVFEFLYADMRSDATLINIYFIMPDGSATLPPEADRENVLAFGRNFISDTVELKDFLA